MTFHLTTKAKSDLFEIALYTQEIWGARQRNIYLKQIDDTFHLVSKTPNKGRACDHIKQGYFKIAVGKHVVFYRKFNKTEIQIVRILHVSMDVFGQVN